MSLDFTSDLEFMLEDAGERATIGGASFLGFLRLEETPLLDESGVSSKLRTTTFDVRPQTLPASVIPDAVIIIGGTSYRITDIGPKRTDGLATLTLVQVTG